MSEDEIREIARGEAEQAITNRTIPDFPMYDADQALHTRINELEKKVARLSKPWWKLW